MGKMVGAISAVNNAVRTLLVLILLVFLSTISWYAYTTYHEQELALAAKDLELEKATAQIGKLQREVERVSLRLKLLKIDRRVARLHVLSQKKPEGAQRVQTTLAFVELDEHGTPLTEPQNFTIDGDMVFVNYKVVKFEDELVETQDPLRSASIALIQKIYGEFQQPAEGFVIDKQGERPQVYGIAEEMSDYERELWNNFWDIANDPSKASDYGVRAAHEESPGMKVRPGKKYELEIRSSGGLSIRPLPEDAEI